MSRTSRTKAKRAATIAVAVGATAAVLVACHSMATANKDLPPLALADKVDVPRFMGDWYVIASIPTAFEKDAIDAKDSYRLDGDGSIDITFSYREGATTAPLKDMRSRGFVQSPTGAVWGVQFIWPIKADYRISYLAADYSATVIAREKRDYVWIMARTKTLPEAEYARLVDFVARQGYDTSKLRRVPQQA